VQDKAGFIPNVFLAFARRPDEWRAFFAYHDALMLREQGSLTKGEREMIVTATSAANQCLYCVVAHGAILRIYEKNPLVADQVHGAPGSTVTAGGATLRHELLAPEGDDTVAAIAGLYVDFRFVGEHGRQKRRCHHRAALVSEGGQALDEIHAQLLDLGQDGGRARIEEDLQLIDAFISPELFELGMKGARLGAEVGEGGGWGRAHEIGDAWERRSMASL